MRFEDTWLPILPLADTCTTVHSSFYSWYMWGCHLRHTHALRAVGWQDAQSFAIGTLFWFMVSEDTTIPGSTPAAHSVPDVPYRTLYMRSEGVKLSSFNSIPYHTIPYHAMPCHTIPCVCWNLGSEDMRSPNFPMVCSPTMLHGFYLLKPGDVLQSVDHLSYFTYDSSSLSVSTTELKAVQSQV